MTQKIPSDLIADDAITLAKMAGGTDGNIISYDASGNPVAIATGDSGEILTSAGAGAPPAFAAAAGGGGKVLQYQFTTDNTGVDCTATGWNEMSTAVRVDLTPTHVDNLVVVFFHAGRFVKGAHNHSLGVDIYGHDDSISSDFGAPGDNWGLASAYYNFGSGDAGPYREFTIMGIDDLSLGTPWSSGAITYKLFGRSDSAATTHQINVNDDTYWIFSAMEIDKT